MEEQIISKIHELESELTNGERKTPGDISKAAHRRARKMTLELEKLMKQYRKDSPK